MRHCYSEQEGDWIDTICRAMNRWAMASNDVEAEARLWASEAVSLDATGSIKIDPDPQPSLRPAHSSNRARLTGIPDRPGLTAGV